VNPVTFSALSAMTPVNMILGHCACLPSRRTWGDDDAAGDDICSVFLDLLPVGTTFCWSVAWRKGVNVTADDGW